MTGLFFPWKLVVKTMGEPLTSRESETCSCVEAGQSWSHVKMMVSGGYWCAVALGLLWALAMHHGLVALG